MAYNVVKILAEFLFLRFIQPSASSAICAIIVVIVKETDQPFSMREKMTDRLDDGGISMAVITPNLPANLFVSAPAHRLELPEEFQVDLRAEQLVRATVIEGKSGRAILEINRQQYLAQGDRDLRVGQKIDLQVVQIQPRLEFKVLGNSPTITNRLSQSLPLLTRSFDWGQFVGQLQQSSLPQSQSIMKVYSQLQQILNPTAGNLGDLKGNVAMVVAQLQRLSASTDELPGYLSSVPVSLSSMLPSNQSVASADLSQSIMHLLKNLQTQLSFLMKSGERPLLKGWYAETRNLLAPFQGGQRLPQFQIPQQLIAVLTQIQQHPRVSPQLAAEVERILIQIDRQARDISQPETRVAVARALSSLDNLPSSEPPAGIKGGEHSLLSADIKQLLDQVQQSQGQGQGIDPELLGQLEGLLSRLQQLPQVAGSTSVLLPGLMAIISQLSQLVSLTPSNPQGGELGLLSQLFGFHLETELLLGRKKAALASLKLSLLNMQKEQGEEVKEPLRRIELFQLCKAKLAEDQVQFLPLPFNGLEEGYLLADRHSKADKGSDESPLQMSLSLRLSALGNIRIDMFYEKGGLHLRLAGEDREKMRYLQNCTDELKESLQAIELQGISFSSDAKLPAQQLQQRLFPDLSSMLDARV